MNEHTWHAVDDYFSAHFPTSDPILEAALAHSAQAGLPSIHVAPNQGKLLMLLAMGARRILEVGTLGGYSTLWLARALPADGQLITLELAPKHAEVARANFARAGVAAQIEVRVGPATESLAQLHAEGQAPFDFIFIDADKPNNTAYFQWALKLARVGTLIIVDNVVRQGRILDATSDDAAVQGTRRAIEAIAAEPRVAVTALQTVGSKSYDGILLARVLA